MWKWRMDSVTIFFVERLSFSLVALFAVSFFTNIIVFVFRFELSFFFYFSKHYFVLLQFGSMLRWRIS